MLKFPSLRAYPFSLVSERLPPGVNTYWGQVRTLYTLHTVGDPKFRDDVVKRGGEISFPNQELFRK